MAIMSRVKKAKGQTWAIKNAEKEGKVEEVERKPLSEDEHKAMIENLKKIGLIK